jgi:hypothetical protein
MVKKCFSAFKKSLPKKKDEVRKTAKWLLEMASHCVKSILLPLAGWVVTKALG